VSGGGGRAVTQWAQTSHCRVTASRRAGRFALVELLAPAVATRARPGQFVMVTVPDGLAFLRRPLSLARVRDDRVSLLVEARGRGSGRLAALEVGEGVDLAGPLGSNFPVDGVGEALLVGGGIGCAPLEFLADALLARGARVTAACGFRDRRAARLAALLDLPALHAATEDGSVGCRGTVLDLVQRLDPGPGTVVYACGPTPMLAAVQRWCARAGLRGWVSLEAHMACGTGSCHGCVVETARGRQRVCSEGPVFALGEVRL